MARFRKLARVVFSGHLLRAFAQHRVLAGTEHKHAFSSDLRSVVDIGANRGQFALAARHWAPRARINSFEPLTAAADRFRQVFRNDSKTTLHESAIGPSRRSAILHVSHRDDSSSLLAIGAAQISLFPRTAKKGALQVKVGLLEDFVTCRDIKRPALLKLDVQGFELEALKGCESMLNCFAHIYAECSFRELYEGQALADDVIGWLRGRGFDLTGVYNVMYDREGKAVQADFMFEGSRL